MDLVEKTITLEDGNDYVVVDAIINDNKTYLLMGKIIPNQEDVEDEFQIAELNDGIITILENADLVEKLKQVFSFNLEQ